MASPPAWVPGQHCGCGEKVLAVGLTPSELYDIVADDFNEPPSLPRGSGLSKQRQTPAAPAAALAAAEPPRSPPLPAIRPLCPICRASSLDDLQQMAALMALQQPSRHRSELSLEPATPLVSERHFGAAATQPSQSDRAGSTGSVGSGTQVEQGSPKCSQSGSSAFRFESVNRVAAVAGNEYTTRRSGERERRSREKDRRWSDERPIPAAGGAAAPSLARPHRPYSQRHSRLSSTQQRALQPVWQPPPAGRLGPGSAAQRLADVPLLPPDPQLAVEYDSSGVAAWLAESAAAADGEQLLVGPDEVLQAKLPAACCSHGPHGSAPLAPVSPQPKQRSPGPAASQHQQPAAAMAAPAAPVPEPEAGQVPVPPSGCMGKPSPAAVTPAPPASPAAPAPASAAWQAASADMAAPQKGAAAAQPSSKPAAKVSCCSSDAEGQAGCAPMSVLALLGRLLRF